MANNVVRLVVRATNQANPGLADAMRSVRRTVRRMRDTMSQGWRASGRAAWNAFTGAFRQGENNVRSGWRNIGRTAGRAIGDGMANGIGNGLRTAMSNPFVAMGVLALVTALATFVGSAIGGLLVLAIGGAFVGLGAASAIQTDEIQRNWKVALDKIKGHFKTLGDGLVPIIHRSIHKLEEVADKVAPHIRQALTAAAPHVEEFTNHIIRGFERLGNVAAKPLEDAFSTLLVALGPMLEETLEDIGESLAQLANTVRDHSTEIAIAVNMVFQLIVLLIEIINFLAEAWSFMLRTAAQGFGVLLGSIATVLEAMAKIPGMGFLSGAARDVRNLATEYQGLGEKLDHANRQRTLVVDIKSFKARLALARADLKKTSNTKARAKIQANIDDLNAKIRAATRKLNAMDGKTATTYIYTEYLSNETARRRGSATGGITGAATGGARSNMTMVGEHGPELVSLPGGSRVTSNEKSRQLIAKGGGGAAPGMMMLNLSLGGVGIGRVLVDLTRSEVLNQGGDVQAVLGERTRAR